jgi:hypothetical protein
MSHPQFAGHKPCARWFSMIFLSLFSLFSLFSLLGWFVILPVIEAQEPTPTSAFDAPQIVYGEIVATWLDNATPSRLYTFEGRRGEYLEISVTVTSGTLDPVLTVLDSSGNTLVTRDDSEGTNAPHVRLLRIPANGVYTLVVGRFGYGLGSTFGNFELIVNRIGVSFETGSALRYGDTVANSISASQVEVYYSFRADRGDIISLNMLRDSGSLDPYLYIVDRNRRILAENDDRGDGSTNAGIDDLVIENTDSYLIIATRRGGAAGPTSGEFLLTLQRADASGVGTSAQVAIQLQPNQPVEGEINEERLQVFYAFQARRDEIITLRMSRIGGTLDSYLSLTNANLEELVNNDDVAEGNQNSQIAEYRIPADGTYYVVATRYSGEGSATTGRYRLELVSVGNAFETVDADAARIVYGSTATGNINSGATTALFAFYGVQGDTLTSTVTRSDGSLIPTLALLDANERVLSTGTSEDNLTARIERFTLPRSGIYYLRVSRAEPPADPTSGSFIIVLAELFN